MKKIILLLSFVILSVCLGHAQSVIKLGIIGLDTSHSPAFIKHINNDNPKPEFQGFKVVAAYPYGSRAIQSSLDRIPGYIEEAKANGVKITSSIAELLDQVDCVFLETNDGNLHLEQAIEVIKAGKTVFIDKPIGANLAQSIAIYELAKQYNVPVFSSSALRFVPQNQALRAGEMGKILGADCYSPAVNEPSHADFYWYGIHGVETLFTIMGAGCQTVACTTTPGADVAVGLWNDGRIGTFRGIRDGLHSFGGTAFCDKKIELAGGYDGYERLLAAILVFFKTKKSPVPELETMEIYTFMEAANESKRQGGKPVKMVDAYNKAVKEANKLMKNQKK